MDEDNLIPPDEHSVEYPHERHNDNMTLIEVLFVAGMFFGALMSLGFLLGRWSINWF
jgi:hypothetical protein